MSTWWLGKEQLRGEQQEILRLAPEKSFLLVGPPGSGKTNLLLLRANHLYLVDHPNLAVVVFTKTLQRFIEMGANQYAFPDEKVMTSWKWQTDLLQQFGVGIPVFESGTSFERKRARLNELIQEQLIERKRLKAVFDALLIDEAHDYTPAEIETFRRLSKVLVLSADSRQKIYSTPDAMATMRSVTSETIALTHHYRVGRNICRLADLLGESLPDYTALLGTCQYDEATYPSSLATPMRGTLEQQARTIVEQLGVQFQAYPDELIGVLAPTNEVARRIWESVADSAIAPSVILHSSDDRQALGGTVRACISTIHSAKGLEFRAVHLAGADRLNSFDHARNLAFTAVTRAKTAFAVYHDGAMPGFLESAYRTLQPAKPVANLDDLFGNNGKRGV